MLIFRRRFFSVATPPLLRESRRSLVILFLARETRTWRASLESPNKPKQSPPVTFLRRSSQSRDSRLRSHSTNFRLLVSPTGKQYTILHHSSRRWNWISTVYQSRRPPRFENRPVSTYLFVDSFFFIFICIIVDNQFIIIKSKTTL